MATDIEKTTISLKTAIIIAITVVTWAISVAGVYYSLNGRAEDLEKRVIELETQNKTYDPKLTDYRLSQLTNQMNEINIKADRILTAINK